MASASHRGILESPSVTGDETVVAARDDETADTFVTADRARVQELQSELPPVSSTPLVMSPDQAARHGNAERNSAGQRSVSPARSMKRAASAEATRRSGPDIAAMPASLTTTGPNDLKYKLSDRKDKPASSEAVTLEDQVTTLETKNAKDNFEMVQRVNDLDRKLIDLEKTVVGNGVTIVDKISTLEQSCISLSERMTELSLIMRDLKP